LAKALFRTIFPEPVALNLLAAPRLVFIFGILILHLFHETIRFLLEVTRYGYLLWGCLFTTPWGIMAKNANPRPE
jgi:hypothetical protein